MVKKKITLELTPTEAKAAYIALSNYTGRKPGWKQAAQARAQVKLRNRISFYYGYAAWFLD